MASRELSLWFDEHRWDALEEALANQASDIETHMTQYFIDLYLQMVPDDEQTRIEALIRKEQEQAAAEREAAKRYAVLHITEHGEDEYISFRADNGWYTLSTASKMRAYVHRGKEPLRKMFVGVEQISKEQYAELVAERLDNSPRVAAVHDINWDSGCFSVIDANGQWKTYHTDEVCRAAYYAERKTSALWSEKVKRFQEKLEGKTILPDDAILGTARRLQTSEINPDEDIVQNDNILNFYLAVPDAIDEILGVKLCTDTDDDWLNIYANYDLERRQLCDELEIYHDRPGKEVSYRYPLSSSERIRLTEKLDEYCKHRWGQSLAECCTEYLEEAEQIALQQDVPQM